MNKELMIENISAGALAQAVGTPVMVFSQTKVEQQLNLFKQYLVSQKFQTQVLYAGKAFTCPAMLELVKQADCGLDTVSGGEIDIALRAGFDMSEAVFHGNNKSPEEILEGLKAGVGTFVIDTVEELDRLIAITSETGAFTGCMIRINPHISVHTHQYDITGDKDCKFGIAITDLPLILDMVGRIEACSHLEFRGLHTHIGSQIFEKDAFVKEISAMFNLISDLKKAGFACPWLDLGGGFAAYYTQEDHPIPIPDVCRTIIAAIELYSVKTGVTIQRLLIEPGRSIVAEACTTLYTVGAVKDTYSKRYLFVDGGMNENIRPALYQAKYNCDLVNRMDEPKTDKVTVAGKCCESGDILAEDVMLPPARVGDILAAYTTGAYGYSMASNYNRLGRPPVVFVKGNTARVVIRRETYADMSILECNEAITIN